MRRTVATLLVVASPLLLAAPVSAEQSRSAPAVVAAPATPPPAQWAAPAAPAPLNLAPPAVQAPVNPIVTPPATPVVARPAVRKVRAAGAPGAVDLNDAAYSARLQAELCHARQVFCGLDHSGHYPAG